MPLQLAQQVEGVRLPPRDVADTVEPGIVRAPRQRLGTLIHGDHFGRGSREVERKRAVVGEEIEGAAA